VALGIVSVDTALNAPLVSVHPDAVGQADHQIHHAVQLGYPERTDHIFAWQFQIHGADRPYANFSSYNL
jgi:hypothetical protein